MLGEGPQTERGPTAKPNMLGEGAQTLSPTCSERGPKRYPQHARRRGPNAKPNMLGQVGLKAKLNMLEEGAQTLSPTC
ncbi:hypothetical protein RRG08_005375 [Elysia crispata]|uniref:Uncharacterized protein n=1 Tax=Elysia crispata TaxID=231223 RepID=A0AAE0ZSC2_9GAST|nr:hypothetical protein RRG08_005375 [Elysia crispata]